MAQVDKDVIRARVAGLLEQRGEPQAFDEGLHDLLRTLGSEEQAAGAARFIPGMGESYGVPLPAVRVIAAELAKFVGQNAILPYPFLTNTQEGDHPFLRSYAECQVEVYNTLC